MKLVSAFWNELSLVEKEKYEELSRKDRIRYDEEKLRFNSKKLEVIEQQKAAYREKLCTEVPLVVAEGAQKVVSLPS